MDLLLHFKVNEGDENNINIQEYMLYGDVETKSEKCLVDEAMEEYYYNITKGGFYIPDRIKEGYMEEDYDNLSNEDIEL